MTLVLTLVPEDPAVFSATAATLGPHETRDAPTGSALLGWAARQLYDRLDPVRQHRLFHSGRIRFSDAVPLHGGEPVFSRPEILLRPKQGGGEPVLGRPAFEARFGPDRQAREVEMCRVTLLGGAAPKPARGHRLRNSRHSDALFGYAHLEAEGAVYRALVDSDEPFEQELLDLLRSAFEGPLVLGRAGANGYGGGYRVTFEPAERNPWPGPQRTGGRDMVRLWCLTDVAMADALTGAPKFAIEPEDAGLAGWEPVPAETGGRLRRYAPWNRALGGREGEIAAIAAGAIFTFRWPGPAPAPDVTVPAVIGMHRERGLGRVTLIPEDFCFRPAQGSEASRAAGAAAGAPQTDLAKWAMARAGERGTRANRDQWVKRLEGDLQTLADQLREAFPAAAQWQQLASPRPEEVLTGDEWKVTIAMPSRWPEMPAGTAAAFPPLADWVQARLLADPATLGLPMTAGQQAEARAEAIRMAVRLARMGRENVR